MCHTVSRRWTIASVVKRWPTRTTDGSAAAPSRASLLPEAGLGMVFHLRPFQRKIKVPLPAVVEPTAQASLAEVAAMPRRSVAGLRDRPPATCGRSSARWVIRRPRRYELRWVPSRSADPENQRGGC
jgi:hypothetical protein